MYLPKSKYTGNLYSNGELAYGNNPTTPYNGYYFLTTKNQTFSGRYPGDGPNLPLSPLIKSSALGVENPESNLQTGVVPISDNGYYFRAKGIYTNVPPIPYYPSPTEQDYEVGEFTRYFAKKANENIYVETRELFENVLYISIQLPWLLTGDKNDVYITNMNMVLLREQQLKISGFGAYLNFNYIKFYK